MRAIARPIGVTRSVAALWEHTLCCPATRAPTARATHHRSEVIVTQCPQQLDADANAEAAESKLQLQKTKRRRWGMLLKSHLANDNLEKFSEE